MIFIDTTFVRTGNENTPTDERRIYLGQSDDEYNRKWKAEVWDPYKEKKSVRTLTFDFVVPTYDEDIKFTKVEVELTTNEKLFKDLLDAYIKFGTAFFRALLDPRILRPIPYPIQDFIFLTIDYVEKVIGRKLLEVEDAATKQAILENTEIKNRLNSLTKLFKYNHYPKSWEIVSMPLDVEMVDGDEVAKIDKGGFALHHSKNELYKLLKQCYVIDSKLKLLKKEIDRRDRVDGGNKKQREKNRVKYPYKEKLLQIWLGPYKNLMIELQSICTRLYEVFPPALMILDKLEGDINDFWLNPALPSDRQYRTSRDVELKYDTLIYKYLKDALLELDNIKVSLTNPGISSTLFRYLGTRNIKARVENTGGIFSLVQDYCLLEKPGVDDALIEALTEGPVLDIFDTNSWKRRQNFALSNRVMANIRPLSNSLGDIEKEEPTFRDKVLSAYIIDLQRKQITLFKQEQASQEMWYYVQIAFGVLAIIIGFTTAVFGFGTIPISAGLGLLASAANSIFFILGVTLLIKTVVTQVKLYGENEANIRVVLTEMALNNTETFQALGQNISRNQDALLSAGIEAIKFFAQMELSSFRIFEFAMDIQMHIDTVDMVLYHDA